MWKEKRRTNLNKQTTVKSDKQQAATESIQNRARKDKQPDFAQWQQILNHHKREITKDSGLDLFVLTYLTVSVLLEKQQNKANAK